MGVYIKNIDISEIKRGAAAIINIDDILFLKTEDDIVLVPDHGDLVDRDIVRRDVVQTESFQEAQMAIWKAPVVIPAERSEE